MVAVVGLAITVLVLIGNSTLTKQISPQSGGSFVNAIDSWYAVIVEGQLLLNQRREDSVIPVTRWVQIYNDHPENGGDKLVHGSGGISQRGRSKTLPPVAFDLF